MKCKMLIGFLIINLLTHLPISSQTVYFNNTYYLSDPGIWSASLTLTECDTGYIICGKTNHNIGIKKIDYFGNDIWSKTWGDSISNWYIGYPGSLGRVDDYYFISGSKNYYSPYSYDVGLLMKLNNEWDTVWTKDYSLNEDDDPDTSLLFNQMDICYNGDLILAGGLYKASTVSFTKFLLARVDSSGNLLWHRTYSYSNRAFNVNDGYSVIQTSDGGFVLGGYWYVIGAAYSGDPILLKTDSLGNQEWMMNIGGPYQDNRPWLCRTNDDNFLVGTIIADTAYTPSGGDEEARLYVAKMDNNGNLLWGRKYGEREWLNYLSNIHCLSDGSIICTGSAWELTPGRIGWIFKLNSVGDSLWYREYYNLSGESSLNYLYDIIRSSDSGFVACGYVSPIPPDTVSGIERVWVLKVDSLGCDTAGCDPTVGIAEEEKGSGGEEEKRSVELWPNPCSSLLSVSLASRQSSVVSRQSNEKTVVEIYDVFGRQTPIPGSRTLGTSSSFKRKGKWIVDVSSLPPGLYLLVVKDGQQTLGSAKFLVAR